MKTQQRIGTLFETKTMARTFIRSDTKVLGGIVASVAMLVGVMLITTASAAQKSSNAQPLTTSADTPKSDVERSEVKLYLYNGRCPEGEVVKDIDPLGNGSYSCSLDGQAFKIYTKSSTREKFFNLAYDGRQWKTTRQKKITLNPLDSSGRIYEYVTKLNDKGASPRWEEMMRKAASYHSNGKVERVITNEVKQNSDGSWSSYTLQEEKFYSSGTHQSIALYVGLQTKDGQWKSSMADYVTFLGSGAFESHRQYEIYEDMNGEPKSTLIFAENHQVTKDF